ncbi:hypothetical protein GCM10008090_21260 [Arenicella chitinivorans]|uniref:Fe/B12 periplasmic-binding domain-containing protein n=2 Tax=Arenicella chitinivorans TaxID=1329800 RepID=A0A918RVT1_9GAMM|nr:hypothetical protein GCM10008090_21260 [Arenicella chitinivorans]
MLALGEVPIGMADIATFQQHAATVDVSENTQDVGTRLSPDLKRIKSLQPDVILIGYSQRALMRPLSNIAPVVYFKNFGKRYQHAEKSRARFLELAKLFDKTALAESLLQRAEQASAQLRASIDVSDRQLVLRIVAPSERHAEQAVLFGSNSMPYYAAELLGLSVVSAVENDQYGTHAVTWAQLAELESVIQDSEQNIIICPIFLSSYASPVAVARSKFAPNSTRHAPEYQNAFGGALSIYTLAEAFAPIVQACLLQ